ncbi:MAG: zinc ribbon domain-containing protein [Chloroflexi bacterium]|nr:zinc ribbon domain-containing protein [Chloroflexota bacterium]
MHCSHCGTENEADAYSCSRCGERVYAPDVEHPSPLGLVSCPGCSGSNETNARYCWKCGASLESAIRVSPQGAATTRAVRPAPPLGSQARPAHPPPPRPAPPRPAAETPRDPHPAPDTPNDSGTRDAALPGELRGWNWGAFLLDFAWGLGNRVWPAAAAGVLAWLLFLVTPMPAQYLMFVVLMGTKVLLGLKGNEWAWRSRQWESARQFKLIQRMWMNWGTIIVIIVILIVMWTRTSPVTDVPTS